MNFGISSPPRFGAKFFLTGKSYEAAEYASPEKVARLVDLMEQESLNPLLLVPTDTEKHPDKAPNDRIQKLRNAGISSTRIVLVDHTATYLSGDHGDALLTEKDSEEFQRYHGIANKLSPEVAKDYAVTAYQSVKGNNWSIEA